MSNHNEIIKDNWNYWAKTWYQKYRTESKITKIVQQPQSAFHPSILPILNNISPDLQGKKVLVPSSGDNHAVFALHLMGAKVTSCDISESQLEYSFEIAQKYGWDIEFVCEDTMSLDKIKSNDYDFVYTSNGVHVWINDLHAMYNAIVRVLKPNGSYMMFDIHPFLRPFAINTLKQLNIVKPYNWTGPFGDIPTYKWRMQDIMNAMSDAGLTILHVEEMFAEDGTFWLDESIDEEKTISKQELITLTDWNHNPLAALPQWLAIHAINRGLT